MAAVEDDEAVDNVGMVHRRRPGDDPAPIVADDVRLVGAEVADQGGDVAAQVRPFVIAPSHRLVGEVVAAHVGRDDPEAAEPKLREAMEQEDEWPASRFHVVEAHSVDLRVAVEQARTPRSGVGSRATAYRLGCLEGVAVAI
jgi:hypothetical protein